jgi:uncharacterized membrane protein
MCLGGRGGEVASSILPAAAFQVSAPELEPYAEPPLVPAGLALGMARIAAVLTVVVTASIAVSAVFTSSLLAITVSGVALYGSGLLAALLGLRRLSPAHLVQELPNVLSGTYCLRDECALIGGWLGGAALLAVMSGLFFARRDI